MTWTISAFTVFVACLLVIVVHYCFFSRTAVDTARHEREAISQRVTKPFGTNMGSDSLREIPDEDENNGDGDDDDNESKKKGGGGSTRKFLIRYIDAFGLEADEQESPGVQDESTEAAHDKKVDDGDKKEPADDDKKPDDDKKDKDDDDNKKGKDDKKAIPHPDYPNPIAVMTPTSVPPDDLMTYRLLSDENGAAGTKLFANWSSTLAHFKRMFTFQHEVLRYVSTEANNAIGTIDVYVRTVAVLRDFAQRFVAINATAAARDLGDWRMFLTMAAAHFAQCLYFVRDRSVRDVARACVDKLVTDPFTVSGRTPEDVDDITAYRLANAWIFAKQAEGLNSNTWRHNASFQQMLQTLFDKVSPRKQWLYYEPLPVDHVVRLRDSGRLLQGRIPFYGDLWLKYVHIRNVRKLDSSVNAAVGKMADFDCLSLLMHMQVPDTCFGMFGPGVTVPSYWLWPITKLGLAAIPSIGFLRMYEQNYSWSMRIMNEVMPFYTYMPGRFNLRDMHVFSQNRMFVHLGDTMDNGNFQPGCVVLDCETEDWVLKNCTVSKEAGDLVALYPLRASGAVMASHWVGAVVQRYEMFRGLVIEEWVLLDYKNNRIYVHVVINNNTDYWAQYFTSSIATGTVRRVPPRQTITVYSYAEFDDPAFTSRILCHPMSIQTFFSNTEKPTQYYSFLENGKLYYSLVTDDQADEVHVITRDDMIQMPESIVINEQQYTFDPRYNQYVRLVPLGSHEPHTAQAAAR